MTIGARRRAATAMPAQARSSTRPSHPDGPIRAETGRKPGEYSAESLAGYSSRRRYSGTTDSMIAIRSGTPVPASPGAGASPASSPTTTVRSQSHPIVTTSAAAQSGPFRATRATKGWPSARARAQSVTRRMPGRANADSLEPSASTAAASVAAAASPRARGERPSSVRSPYRRYASAERITKSVASTSALPTTLATASTCTGCRAKRSPTASAADSGMSRIASRQSAAAAAACISTLVRWKSKGRSGPSVQLAASVRLVNGR